MQNSMQTLMVMELHWETAELVQAIWLLWTFNPPAPGWEIKIKDSIFAIEIACVGGCMACGRRESARSLSRTACMQVLWGDALLRVEEGLSAGRRWLWDEASRKAGTLIAAPSAFQGEHFLQVPCPPRCPAPAPAP